MDDREQMAAGGKLPLLAYERGYNGNVRPMMRKLLELHNGNVDSVADDLGVWRRTVCYWLENNGGKKEKRGWSLPDQSAESAEQPV